MSGEYKIEISAGTTQARLSFSGITEFTTEPTQLTYTLTKE